MFLYDKTDSEMRNKKVNISNLTINIKPEQNGLHVISLSGELIQLLKAQAYHFVGGMNVLNQTRIIIPIHFFIMPHSIDHKNI